MRECVLLELFIELNLSLLIFNKMIFLFIIVVRKSFYRSTKVFKILNKNLDFLCTNNGFTGAGLGCSSSLSGFEGVLVPDTLVCFFLGLGGLELGIFYS